MSPATNYKTVCYRCRYVGVDSAGTRCPDCGFPLIMKKGVVGEDGPKVREIFDRTSVSVNAPPLPGVDGRPHKAQLLAEARRRRQAAALQPAAPPILQPVAVAPVQIVAMRYPHLKVACAFVSALFAGLGTAVLMNGGL